MPALHCGQVISSSRDAGSHPGLQLASSKQPSRNPPPPGDAVENIWENHDRPANSWTDGPHVGAGTWQGRVSAGAGAKASTAEAVAYCSVAHARAEGPNVSAGTASSPLCFALTT